MTFGCSSLEQSSRPFNTVIQRVPSDLSVLKGIYADRCAPSQGCRRQQWT